MGKNTRKHQTYLKEEELKKAYKVFLIDSNIKRILVGCFFGLSLVPAGAIFDYLIYPSQFLFFLSIRLIFTVFFLGVYLFSFTKMIRRFTPAVMIFLAELIAIPIVIMIQYTGGYESPYYAGLILVFIGVCILFTNPIQALIACGLIYGTYLLPIYFSQDITNLDIFLNNNYFLSFTMIMTVLTNYFSSNLRASDFKNRFQLETAYKELKDTQSQLLHSAKLASVGQLAAGVAHELNNALNAASLGNSRLKELTSEAKTPELICYLEKAKVGMRLLNNGINRAHGVVKNLLSFSKKNSEGFQYQNIHTGIESSLQILNNEFKDRVTVHCDFCSDGEIYCDLHQLNQVFLNILKNSSDAINGAGNIWIKTERKTDQIYIIFKDDGCGISEDKVDKIFDPFFTTKEVGKGTGLGLSVSYNIIKGHYGAIDCKSELNKGSEFIVTLPINLSKRREDYERADRETI